MHPTLKKLQHALQHGPEADVVLYLDQAAELYQSEKFLDKADVELAEKLFADASITESAEPLALGSPFHNPYTFIPFPKAVPSRAYPTPLTIDEALDQADRFTGILDLEITLLSPLLTSVVPPFDKHKSKHKELNALTIGKDVVLPGTGVKGALRSLLTILSGGTLSHIDDNAWLCQGRDNKLGPRTLSSEAEIPKNIFIGQVIEPGNSYRSGEILLGKSLLVDIEQIAYAITKLDTRVAMPSRVDAPPVGKKSREYERYLQELNKVIMPYRPSGADKEETIRKKQLYANIKDIGGGKGVLLSVSNTNNDQHPWLLKLSERPVNLGQRRPKSEGAFLPNHNSSVTLAPHYWLQYGGQNRHGSRPELKQHDLIWLKPVNPDCETLRIADDIDSIHWARWSRQGENLLEVIIRDHRHMLPDSMNPDGKVDEITNLFGHVPRGDIADKYVHALSVQTPNMTGPAPAFAGRVRFGNLVFTGAADEVKYPTTLAPLSAPHPGCCGFYRDTTNIAGDSMDIAAKIVRNKDFPLRGFKVYRTTSERGQTAPWNYDTQPIYDDAKSHKERKNKMNHTVHLLAEGSNIKGRLKISVRALSHREIMLLLAACSVDWRLGGGKPLGLGHCKVSEARLYRFTDEGNLDLEHIMTRLDNGQPSLPEKYANILKQDKAMLERMNLWQATQQQVNYLRYPRAVSATARGGHVWFARHAAIKKQTNEPGLDKLYLGEPLNTTIGSKSIRGQVLPYFNKTNPLSDTLFGYDIFWGDKEDGFQVAVKGSGNHWLRIEKFDIKKHDQCLKSRKGSNLSQNISSRQYRRDSRDSKR